MSLKALADVSILADGLDHPECVAWGLDGNLYAGGEAGQIYRVNMSGEIIELASTGGFILGVCLDGRGEIYACDLKRRAVMRVDRDREVFLYSNGAPNRQMELPNYAVFDAAGNMYVSDSGSWHGNNGCLFLVKPNRQTQVISTEVAAFPNGMALSPNGEWLYVVLSNLPGVVRLPIMTDGRVGTMEKVVELPGAVPDGLAFDREGSLYISCYTPDLIYRFSSNGKLTILVEDWERTMLSAPTNITFAGPELSTLVTANFGVWHLGQLQMEVPGAPLHYPRVS